MPLLDQECRNGSADVSGPAGDHDLHKKNTPFQSQFDLTLDYYTGRTGSKIAKELFKDRPQTASRSIVVTNARRELMSISC
jgi:hypothetical protein